MRVRSLSNLDIANLIYPRVDVYRDRLWCLYSDDCFKLSILRKCDKV